MTAMSERSPHVKLAAEAIAAFVCEGQIIPVPKNLPLELAARAGAFVCIKANGMLRGCIGTIEPCRGNLAEEIIHNAISAATKDPRFRPVGDREIPHLEVSVDVLMPSEQVDDLSELDAKRYGVIVKCGRRRGLLLPDLDGVDTPEQQVRIAMSKAGISPDEAVDLFRFEVNRYE